MRGALWSRSARIGRGNVLALVLTAFLVGCSGAASRTTISEPSPASTATDLSRSESLPPGSSTPATNQPRESLRWVPCTDPKATDPALQCATLTVPLDYSAASGGDTATDGTTTGDTTIDLALVRVPATSSRTGAVLFNPGGPGGSGFDSITIASSLGLSQFDLIGFDPRGVDRSNGIRCLTDAQQDAQAYLDDTPDTPDEQAALDAANTAFADACTTAYGDTLRDYSTTNTARDIEAIRVALGDDTISYLGISYGTYLGAVYATMFPDRVRALVLDSAFEPSGDTIEQQYETQLVGFEHAFDDWATWCRANTTCRFTAADVGAAWDALLRQLDAQPITNSDGRLGNQVVMRSATIAALYSKADWPVLGAALQDAVAGDPSALFRLADGYSGRDTSGHYSTIQQSNTVINCASGIEGETPPDPAALVARLQSVAPRFAQTLSVDDFTDRSDCSMLMPAQPIDTLHYVGDAPIVVIGGTNDPATPFRWAQEMTAAMGPSARLVTYTGEGHGQLLASKCVTEIEASLLTDEHLPNEQSVCDPDPDIARPNWWDSIPLPEGIDAVFDSPEVAAALGITTTDIYSELHTSTLDAQGVLAIYEPALVAAGFARLGEQQPLTGSEQAVYTAPNGDFFSVLALDPTAFDDPQLESAKGLVPDGKSVVLLLYIPR